MLKVCSSVVEIRTHGPMKLFDVTNTIAREVEVCGIEQGILRIDVKGATPALLLANPQDLEEILGILTKLIPFSGWRHGNAYAHLISTLITTSLVLAIEDKEIVLPKDMRIYMLETRSVYNHVRQIAIEIIGRAES